LFDIVTRHEQLFQSVAILIPLNISTKEILAHWQNYFGSHDKTISESTDKITLDPARGVIYDIVLAICKVFSVGHCMNDPRGSDQPG